MNRLAFLFIVFALLGVNAYVYSTVFAAPTVRIMPLAVGQGDALLVRFPKGHAVLVNAGADASIVRALGEALPPWQRHIDALILLSDTKDEVGGEPFVLSTYRVGTVQKIPRSSAGIVLHYGSLALALSSTTPPGAYAVK